jgi:hypothetical protein
VEIINACNGKLITEYVSDKSKLTENDKQTLSEFMPCCTKEEMVLLRDVINKVIEHKPYIHIANIYIAVIYTYYHSIVVEYYMQRECHLTELSENYRLDSVSTHKNDINDDVTDVNLPVVRQLIFEMVASNEPWASVVRRKLNNLRDKTVNHLDTNIGGRKLKKKTIRRSNKRKNNRKLRKTKRIRKINLNRKSKN